MFTQAQERPFSVEICLQHPAPSGEGVSNVAWSASMVRTFLADQLTKVRVPVQGIFGHGVPSAMHCG